MKERSAVMAQENKTTKNKSSSVDAIYLKYTKSVIRSLSDRKSVV